MGDRKTVLVPLPRYGFDPTESAVPWKAIVASGHRVVFATPDARAAQADRRMLTGEDLPLLFRGSLMASPEVVPLYEEMSRSPEFMSPIAYDGIRSDDYDAILLPGGHDKGMREYLESTELQGVIAEFFEKDRPVGAICHGTLLVARSMSRSEAPELLGKSVLWGRKTTGLTQNQELLAFNLTRWWLGDYYRTYPKLMADEVISHLKSPSDYDPGPGFPVPLRRDAVNDLDAGFILRDGNYLSARWPGDAHRFAREFVKLLEDKAPEKN